MIHSRLKTEYNRVILQYALLASFREALDVTAEVVLL